MNDALNALIQQLRSGDLHQEVKSSLLLHQFGSEAVEPLLEIIQDESLLDKWWLAAQALGYIGDKRAVEPLITMLKNPLSFKAGLARKYTAYALAELADPRAIEILIEMLYEPVYIDEDDDEDLIRDEIDTYDHETIEAAAGALATIGEWRGIKAVIDRFLEGTHWHDHNMGEWGGEAAFQYILEALKSENPVRRERAASLLGEFGDKRATLPLIELLRAETEGDVRPAATYGLATLHDPRAFNTLLLALQESDFMVQLHGTTGINYLITPGFYKPDERPDVELMVRGAVKEIGEANIVRILTNALNSSSNGVKDSAAQFLNAFKPFFSPPEN